MQWQTDVAGIGFYDTVVCGGGPAGSAAALAAARSGLKTLLVDAEGQLGGMATSGLVSHWLGGRTADCHRWVVGGVFRELSEAAVRRGAACLPEPEPDGGYSPRGWGRGSGGALTAGVPVDPHGVSVLYDETMAAAGVEVLLKTTVLDTVVEQGRIQQAILHNKSGLQAVSARVFVDATGDADVASRSGCPTHMGREEDRLMTPVTLQVHMDRIDGAELKRYITEHRASRFLEEIKQWREEGDWPFSWDRFISVQLLDDDTFLVNSPRVTGVDGTDGASVTAGMVHGRREIDQLLDIMRRRVPGCRRARIKAVAGLLGVRETRRIVGDYELGVDDVVSGTAFGDTVGFSAYGWDLPDPKRPSYQPLHERKLKKPPVVPIPYRVMLPRGIDNLLCPGRAVSVERDVLGPLRVMAPCMAMGEAAGVAAAQVVERDCTTAEVDPQAIRDELRRRGAVVDWRE